MTKFLVFLIVLLTGCAYPVPESEVAEMEKSIIGAQLSDMSRTNAIGTAALLPVGTPIRNLMQTELDPGEYTIQFSVMPPSDGQGFSAYAIVNWKVAGHQLRRLISVASGAVISGVADAVDVQLVDVSGAHIGGNPPLYPALANGNPDPRQLYKVAATLSRGSRPSLNQPGVLAGTKTGIAVASTTTQRFVVPQDAGVISAYVFVALPFSVGDTPQQIIASQIDAGGSALSTFSPTSPGWVPLISGCSFVDVDNETAHTQLINILWGIDG